MAKIRIMLADDHTLFRQGIRTLISAEADMEVVGDAPNGGDAVEGSDALGQPNAAVQHPAFFEDSYQRHIINRLRDLKSKSKIVILMTDGQNNVIWMVRRSDGHVVGRIGRTGQNAGQFHALHSLGSDADGNLYTGENQPSNRIQKFVRIGRAATR